MYETEVNDTKESVGQISSEIAERFAELREVVLQRTVLPWSEHCTECVWPSCYSTCDLYRSRKDGRCRRFTDGMVRIDCPQSINSYVLKIRFKRWGKLWTPGNIKLRAMKAAHGVEQRDYLIGGLLQSLPNFVSIQRFAIHKRYSFKKRIAYDTSRIGELPTSFVLECYNPSDRTINLSLAVRSVDSDHQLSFQKLIELTPGFHRIRTPYEEIARLTELSHPFNIDLTPNEEEDGTTLYFGLMEFVREQVGETKTTTDSGERQNEAATKIKCVVWDLDHTIWDGILVEDGLDGIRLKPRIRETLQALDERGILLSIASKNNAADALGALKRFGIADYFLHPQVSWKPKSQAVYTIAKSLNIGLDTLLFVDDLDFELEQVRAAHPEVQTLKADSYLSILDLESCRVSVTEESRMRRKMYQVESQRKIATEHFAHNYMGFLRDCEIRLKIQPMTEENLDRVHELTQRTNQMNFSGNRYEKSILRQIIDTPYLETYVLTVEDRFGSYGIVGFCIVDKQIPLMTDLMFSCRVQSKRVEHAFLAYIIRKYISLTGKDFYANYRQTARNAPSGKVFSDLLLEEVSVENGVSRRKFPKDREVPNDGIIELIVPDTVGATR
jgi:FkbH-like protein